MTNLYISLPIADFLVQSRVGLENAQSNPEIAGAIAQYGENADRIGEKMGLLVNAENLAEAQKIAYAGQHAATQSVTEARATADKQYSTHRRLALRVFQGDLQRRETLAIHMRKQSSFSKWLTQLLQFYNQALADPAVIDALGRYNITQQDLQAGLALVQEVVRLNQEQEDAKGKAQQATRDRDAALQVLGRAMSELREIAQIGLADRPDLYQSLQFGPAR